MTTQGSSEIRTETGKAFRVRKAQPQDAEIIRSMLVEAAQWMIASGIRQWNPDQFTPEEVLSYFKVRSLYLAFDGEVPAGMFTLQSTDPDYWGPLNDDGFYYLHRLTVSQPYRSQRLGAALVKWAVDKSRIDDKKGLRLDCRATNDKLNSYYQGLGFRRVGSSELNNSLYTLYQHHECG
ncbi:GNAT family N-acetyltransferase [Paenibacillus caui]|uniref:GNAT family N-acetyltransferase n=1 Tax=Paenibacillus caui TaxID=2873927 RepID=UPI001CA83080|nr:GNAT family N-acetyltransferase [Paenibacillus caui]